ncbi:MAG: Holliday junction branch migration protein RuvA [Clostridia bacterium]|nr:Holliday junction branch migration protein RuvA [Clostridia bacterium]NCC69194.1 Holliday junction branch migration protein RuvA [Clostridia bacterium]
MFHYLEGTVTDVGPYYAVVDCGGLGFELNTTTNTLSQIKTGETARFYIFNYIREDCFDLYGFRSKSEKRSFELLIGISGVGPKAAISILSASTPETLAMAILSGDEKALTIAPGIGKKIAQRVILELKDKISKESADFLIPSVAAGVPVPGQDQKLTDASSALAVLGYGAAEISFALRGVDISGLKTEDIIKTALRNMMK